MIKRTIDEVVDTPQVSEVVDTPQESEWADDLGERAAASSSRKRRSSKQDIVKKFKKAPDAPKRFRSGTCTPCLFGLCPTL